MVFQVNLLIYLYMAICICLLLFNLVYFARDFFKRKRDPEMVRKYMNKLCEMLETSGVEKISQKEEKFWTRKLSKSSGLILFQQAVEELEAKGKQEYIEKWVRNNRDLFYKLSSVYMKKRGMEKVYGGTVEKFGKDRFLQLLSEIEDFNETVKEITDTNGDEIDETE